MGFYHSLLGYLEEGTLRFVNVTNKLELAIGPEDNGQPITNSKDEKVRKKLECVAKRKTQRNNLYTPMQQAFNASSVAFLLSGLALLSYLLGFALLFCFGLSTLLFSCSSMPILSFCLESPTPLLSCLLISVVLSCLGLPTLSSSYLPVPVLSSCPPVLALSSPLVPNLLSLPVLALVSCFVFGPAPTRLIFSALRTFKQA